MNVTCNGGDAERVGLVTKLKHKIMTLIETLKANIGKAGHLHPKMGRDLIIAGIVSVDEKENTVTYLHGNGLTLARQAKEKKASPNDVAKNKANITTNKISLFSAFTYVEGYSSWQ